MVTELSKTTEGRLLNPEFPYMPREEWESRINKARQLMGQNGLDALMILNNDDRLYFFGSQKPYRYTFAGAGIIPREGPTTLIATAEDIPVVKAQGYAERAIGYRGDTRAPTAKSPDPVRLLIEVIEDLGLANGTIGMEFGTCLWWDLMNINQWEELKKGLPKANFVDATDVIWEMRMIKSQWEIEVLRYLYRATSLGYFKMISNARPGVNELELYYDAIRVWMDMKIIDYTPYKLNAMNGCQPFRDRVLKEGDWILQDGGPSYKGYCADIQRMIYIGEPGEDFRKRASSTNRAFQAVEAILKPGTTAGELWTTSLAAVAEVEPDVWKKMNSRKFIGWIGHGEGLNVHEPPYIVDGSTAVLREGMVVALEIPAFFRHEIANMPEDTYLITKDGYERLSKDLGPRDLYVKT